MSYPPAIIRAMTVARHYVDRPCWHCHHYVAMLSCGAAECSLENGARVRSQPERGCSAFQREPGSDDELGPPQPRSVSIRHKAGGRHQLAESVSE